MHRIYYISLVFLFFSIKGFAQSNYSQTNFRTGLNGFTDISATGTAIAMSDNISGSSTTPQEIGFNLNFNGMAFTQFMIHADGILRLGTIAPGAATDISVSPANSHAGVFTSAASTFQNIIMPFFTNLVAGESTPAFHVLTSGNAPNRVCTIQWKNLRDADNVGGGIQHQFSNLEFQVKLYETSNDIEFVYGTFTPSATPLLQRNAACGIKASGTSFVGLYRLNASMPYQKAIAMNPTNHSRITSSYPFRQDVVVPVGFSNRFYGRLNTDLNVGKIYYDSIAPLGSQTAGRLEALVVNEGTTLVNDVSVSIQITGANTYTNLVTIPSLASGASQRVTFPVFNLPNKGQQDVQVSVTGAGDERLANNQLTVQQVISQSHNQTIDFSTNSFSGVGFTNAGTNNLYAIKMYGSGTRKIRQLRIPFGTYRNLVNVRIYEDGGAGGAPSGAPLITSSNFFTTTENITIVSLGEGVTVDGDYFIAVQQTSTANMGWRVNINPPIRNNRYYISNTNGASWFTDPGGTPWELMAEAYEESNGIDIGIETLTSPLCAYTSNAEVKANIRNFSANSIDFSTSPATISGFVRGPDGLQIPVSVLKNSGTLAAGAAEEVTLLTNYNYNARGNHLINVRTNLAADTEKGNDSLRFFINNNIRIASSAPDPICPLTSVTLTASNVYGNLQWNVNGAVSGGTTRVLQPTQTTVVRISGTDYRGCLLQDSIIVEVKGNDLPPRPILIYGDTVLSHRNGFRDTVRVQKLAGHTIQFVESFANGVVVSDSAYALPVIVGMNGAKVAAAYVRSSDGCANLSDTLTYRYAPGVLQNNFEPLTVCDTAFYDSGGPSGNTGNSFTRTFTPSTPGTKMKVTFYRLDLAQNASIQIFDGPTANNRIDDLRSQQNGNIVREFISSHETGALTIQFSLGSFTSQGWWAGLTCYTPEIYRTVQAGNWITAQTWERKAPGGTYLPATRPPHKGDDSIYVRHNIILSTSTPMDQIIIEEGATMEIGNPPNLISIPAYKTVDQPEFLVKGTLNISPQVFIHGAGGQMFVQGRLNNFGQVDFDSVVFNGTAPQTLGDLSSASGSMNRLHINNPAGLTMGSDQRVTGFRFVNGRIHTNSENIITLRASADPANMGNDGSHINGPLIVELASGSGDRLFPIGKNGKYRQVMINNDGASSELSDRLTAEVIEGAPPTRTLPDGINKVSELRYFRITRSGNSGSEFRVTFPLLQDDGVTDSANLTILKDNGAGAWIDMGGTASGSIPGTIRSGEFNDFSDFVLANKTGGSNPLPVTWLSFTAKKENANAHLEWRTAQERNCSLYQVERSTDGVNYQRMGTVTCRNSNGNQTYRYADAAPGTGTFYYRIKQVDADGRFEYSAVQQVNFGKADVITVYPNPARNLLQVTGLQKHSEINLYDASGRTVLQTHSSQPAVQLQIGHLPAGMYQLSITTFNGERIVKKVQVMK